MHKQDHRSNLIVERKLNYVEAVQDWLQDPNGDFTGGNGLMCRGGAQCVRHCVATSSRALRAGSKLTEQTQPHLQNNSQSLYVHHYVYLCDL